MKKEELFEAMEGIDEDRLALSERESVSYAEAEQMEKKTPAKKKRRSWGRTFATVAVSAAAIALVFGATQVFSPRMGSVNRYGVSAALDGGMDAKNTAGAASDSVAEADVNVSDEYWSEDSETVEKSTSDMATASSEASSEEQVTTVSGDKIVYNGYIDIQTLSYNDTAAAIRGRISELGGFIESESEYDGNHNWYLAEGAENSADSTSGSRTLNITARVPAEQFDSFLTSLGENGKVISKSVYAENISKVYADREASKQALEKEQARLLSMMDEASDIQDMIAIESRLSQVEKDLNAYNTELAGMDKDVEYSTINISLEEVQRYSEANTLSFGERIQQAAKDCVRGTGVFFQNLVVWGVRHAFAIVFAVVVIFLVVRKIRKKK